MDIWEYMFKQNSFLKTELIVISINIFFWSSPLLLYGSIGWCSSLEVCIILTVTNAGNVETDIIGVHNSAEPWSAHTYTGPCKYWGIYFFFVKNSILCNTRPQFHTKHKGCPSYWLGFDLSFMSQNIVYIWFVFTELMTGCLVNESCWSEKSCKI